MPVRLALAALAAIVLGAAGCGGDEEARPDLAFVSTRDGDYAIFEMNADGGAQHRLTPREVGDITSPAKLFFQVSPVWSPDATQIAFASRRSGSFDIYVMNADGTGTRQLTSGKQNDSHPSWSPDGQKIAYFEDGAIYAVELGGGEIEKLTDSANNDSSPAWNPRPPPRD